MAWNCNLSGKIELVQAAAKASFDQIINHSTPPLNAQEQTLCSAAYQLVVTTLAAQAPGTAIQICVSGSTITNGKVAAPSYTVSFQVQPITGFLL